MYMLNGLFDLNKFKFPNVFFEDEFLLNLVTINYYF